MMALTCPFIAQITMNTANLSHAHVPARRALRLAVALPSAWDCGGSGHAL
jgi:hypothetical protein